MQWLVIAVIGGCWLVSCSVDKVAEAVLHNGTKATEQRPRSDYEVCMSYTFTAASDCEKLSKK